MIANCQPRSVLYPCLNLPLALVARRSPSPPQLREQDREVVLSMAFHKHDTRTLGVSTILLPIPRRSLPVFGFGMRRHFVDGHWLSQDITCRWSIHQPSSMRSAFPALLFLK
jgi:hypothetical protein